MGFAVDRLGNETLGGGGEDSTEYVPIMAVEFQARGTCIVDGGSRGGSVNDIGPRWRVSITSCEAIARPPRVSSDACPVSYLSGHALMI